MGLSYSLFPVHYSLFPIPCSLFLILYPLFPIPYPFSVIPYPLFLIPSLFLILNALFLTFYSYSLFLISLFLYFVIPYSLFISLFLISLFLYVLTPHLHRSAHGDALLQAHFGDQEYSGCCYPGKRPWESQGKALGASPQEKFWGQLRGSRSGRDITPKADPS